MQQCTDTTPLFQDVGMRCDGDTGLKTTTEIQFICGSKVLLAEIVACTTGYNEEE